MEYAWMKYRVYRCIYLFMYNFRKYSRVEQAESTVKMKGYQH